MADVTFVNLYYLGGFVAENPRVSSKGNSYAVPPVGEALHVPDYIARDLIRRNRNPQGVSVFTTDARFAKMVKDRKASGPTISDKPEFSREQLLQMLNDMDAENAPAQEEAPKTRSKANKETE